MATNFYLADSRYMSSEEIRKAESFDESALFCSRRRGYHDKAGLKYFYSLEVHPLLLFNIPKDVRLVNDDNDSSINTVGDLVREIRESEGIIETLYARLKNLPEQKKEWLRSRPDLSKWIIFKDKKAKKNADPDLTSHLMPKAMQYLRRKYTRF